MLDKTQRNCFANSDRDRVTYQSSEDAESNLFSIWEETIRRREGLKNSRFAQGDCAMLCGMTETPVSITKTLGCNCWRWSIPLHAAIHTWVSFAGVFVMAFRNQL